MGAGGAEGGGGGGLVAVCGESHCAEAVAGAAGVSGGYDGSGGVLSAVAVDWWTVAGEWLCENEKCENTSHKAHPQGSTAPAPPSAPLHRRRQHHHQHQHRQPAARRHGPSSGSNPAHKHQDQAPPRHHHPHKHNTSTGTRHRHQAPAPAPAPAQHQQRHRRQRNTGVTGAAWRVCRSTPASPSAPAPAPVHAQQRLPPPAPSPPLAPVQHRQHDRNHPPVVTTQGQGRAKQSQQNKGGKRAPSACQQTQHSGGRWHS